MKLLIAGSRSINDMSLLEFMIAFAKINIEDIEYIISGGADGVDTLARLFSLRNDIPIKEFIPDWSKGKQAGMDRNTLMVNEADKVIIIWDGKSKGALDTYNKCIAAKIETYRYTKMNNESPYS